MEKITAAAAGTITIGDLTVNRMGYGAMRLTGEEAGISNRTAWNAADDQVLNRIARDGMTRLAAFLANPSAPEFAPSAPPAQSPPNVAFLPGGNGILAFAPTGAAQ